MGDKVCPVCGEPEFRFYHFCKKHLDMKKEGLVIKNKNGKWVEVEQNSKSAQFIQQGNSHCLLCHTETKNDYKYCADCYNDIKARIEELDKNQSPTKLKDYYYNAKDYAMRIFDEDKIYYQQLTMLAIAHILFELHKDDDLFERVYKDINKIDENLEIKNKRLEERYNKETVENIKTNTDSDKPKTKKSQDGHFVGSEYEIKVDDILYNNNIVHAYNVKVDEIHERTVTCDWYIPILLNKGIYIELWGVKGNEDYNRNKNEKIDLYKKHKLFLIEIEYDELRNDTQRLKSNLIAQIKKYTNNILENYRN